MEIIDEYRMLRLIQSRKGINVDNRGCNPWVGDDYLYLALPWKFENKF
jgi:hypothetical protein